MSGIERLRDAPAHGLGGSSSSTSWELKGLWRCWAANTTLSECITDPCTRCNTWDCSSDLQPQSTTTSGRGLFRKNGAAPPWRSLRLLPRAWPAEHASLYWCNWEKQRQSEYYFCRAGGNSNSEILLTQVFLTVLYIINIFIITHVQKILHCCKTFPEQIQELSTEPQWRECINSGFLRVTRLCVFSSGSPHKAMIKSSMKLCLNN